ncbi:MAG: acyl carrier protein [Bacteroidales bacterium]|nr:acyl carrier protein [Bacteroidales bacterium]
MTREQIIEKLSPMVREVFDNPALVIDESMSPDTVDGWTSLAFMQLLAKVEETFGVKFKIFELVGIHTLGDLMAAIEKHC